MNIMTSILLSVFYLSCATTSKALDAVPYVELNRYLGQWYEIAKYPNSFQKDCSKASANYSLKKNGEIKVVNTCIDKEGKDKIANARAWIVDGKSNAKLKVQFFAKFFKLPFLAGDYWIIMLGDDYEYSVVSEPKMEYLWILSRTKTLDPTLKTEILNELEARGFDLTKLVFEKY